MSIAVKKRMVPGFTLIEVLVAIVLIVFGCLAALSIQVSSMRSSADAESQTVAVFLAESEIERLKSMDVEALANVAQANEDRPVVETLNRFGCSYDDPACNSGTAFTRTVAYFPKQPTSLSTQVEVRVAWEGEFVEREVFYTAVITSFSF